MSSSADRPDAGPLVEPAVVEAILDYLARHPHASDTLEGIAEWWVLRREARLEVERVARALDWLTGRGVLEADGNGPGRRYRLAAAGRD